MSTKKNIDALTKQVNDLAAVVKRGDETLGLRIGALGIRLGNLEKGPHISDRQAAARINREKVIRTEYVGNQTITVREKQTLVLDKFAKAGRNRAILTPYEYSALLKEIQDYPGLTIIASSNTVSGGYDIELAVNVAEHLKHAPKGQETIVSYRSNLKPLAAEYVDGSDYWTAVLASQEPIRAARYVPPTLESPYKFILDLLDSEKIDFTTHGLTRIWVGESNYTLQQLGLLKQAGVLVHYRATTFPAAALRFLAEERLK